MQRSRAMIVQARNARDLLQSVNRVSLHYVDSAQIIITILASAARNSGMFKIAHFLSR